jgi:hypothetical protein
MVGSFKVNNWRKNKCLTKDMMMVAILDLLVTRITLSTHKAINLVGGIIITVVGAWFLHDFC